MSQLTSSARGVRRSLAGLRAAFVARALVEGVSFGAASALFGLASLLVVLGTAEVAQPLRVWLLAALATIVAVAVVAPAAVAALRYRRDDDVAARAESTVPRFRSDIRSALAFSSALPSGVPERDELRAMLVDRVARELGERHAELRRAATPRRDLRGSAALAAVALLLAGTFRVVAPESFAVGVERLIRGAAGATATVAAAANRMPLVGALDVEIRFPPHTGRPSVFFEGSTGNLEVLAGSDVSLSAPLLTEAATARLVLELPNGPTALALDIVDGSIVGNVTVTQSSHYQIELVTADGVTLVDPIARRFVAVPDNPPVVDLIEPTVPELEVTPDDVINLEYMASDDFGVAATSLIWHFEGEDNDLRVMPLQTGLVAMSWREHVPFDLAPIGLQPRDAIVVFVEASDNNTSSGEPGVARSRPVTLRVASPDDRHDEVLTLEQELAEALVRQLGAVLPARVNEPVLGAENTLVMRPATVAPTDRPSRVSVLLDARPGYLELFEQFERLLAAMAADALLAPADVETFTAARDALYTRFLNQRAQLDRVEPATRAGAVDDIMWQALASADAPLIEQLERTALLVADLLAMHRAEDVQRSIEELRSLRDRLQELLEQYRQTQDPALREQIENELRRLESRMRELMQRLAEQVEQLPEEHLNIEGLEPSEVAESLNDMGSALDDVRQNLDSGNIDQALDALSQLDEMLQGLEQEVGDPLSSASSDTVSEMDREMGEILDQLNGLEEQQRSIEEQTTALEQQMRERRQQEMREQTQQMLDSWRAQLDQMQSSFENAGSDALSETSRAALGEARQELDRLEERVGAGDIAAVEEQAERMRSQMLDVAQQIGNDMMLRRSDSAERAQIERQQRNAQRASEALGRMAAEARELMQQGQPQPTGAEGEQMQQLSQSQQAVQQSMEGLEQRLGELGERLPGIGGEAGPLFRQAAEGMQQSTRELQGGRPQPSMQGQRQALDAMQSIRQQLRQQMQRQRRQSEGGRNNSNERVEIPGENESGRAQFRQQVIDAMRDGSLENYDDAIRRYYESLLR